MKKVLLAAVAALAIGGALASCATPTPYQPAAPGRNLGYGYSDYRIDDTHWRVTFSGNSLTSRETVEKYLLYRAAELTLEQGFDWFDTTDRHTERNTSYYATDPYYHSPFWGAYGWGWRPYWRYYGGPFGWRGWDPWFGSPFWADTVNIQEVSRYDATAEIVLGRNPPPAGHRVFNAREVVANLAPSIARPSPGAGAPHPVPPPPPPPR
jgi:hypothetical protein